MTENQVASFVLSNGGTVEKKYCYDEEGVECWEWEFEGHEWTELGSHDEPPPVPEDLIRYVYWQISIKKTVFNTTEENQSFEPIYQRPCMKTPGILNKKEDGSFEYQIINEWQLCPLCHGTGLIWQKGWPNAYATISTAPITCDLCEGEKIISKVNGKPPI
ncbi:MAG TPA: hypothetical protein VD884_13255 [Ohtaekwangia sp.]|nr:hypothetical protein [Ohtaekwangia sp.]